MAQQWDHHRGLNPAAVRQERQNIIRYWLENLRAKQGESLHNIHFLEGQPISEYGTAWHGAVRYGIATPPPSLSPSRAAVALERTSPASVPRHPVSPALRCVLVAVQMCHGRPKPVLPISLCHASPTGDTPGVAASPGPSLRLSPRRSPRAGCPRRHPAGVPAARAEDPQAADEVLGAGGVRGAAAR